MAVNRDALVFKWVNRANTYLHNPLSWTTKDCDRGVYVMTHEDRMWTIQYSDLEQLSHDLGIFKQMYPEAAADIQPIPVQPEAKPFPHIRYSQKDRAWIIVVDALVYIDANTAGELMNAGIPFKR